MFRFPRETYRKQKMLCYLANPNHNPGLQRLRPNPRGEDRAHFPLPPVAGISALVNRINAISLSGLLRGILDVSLMDKHTCFGNGLVCMFQYCTKRENAFERDKWSAMPAFPSWKHCMEFVRLVEFSWSGPKSKVYITVFSCIFLANFFLVLPDQWMYFLLYTSVS